MQGSKTSNNAARGGCLFAAFEAIANAAGLKDDLRASFTSEASEFALNAPTPLSSQVVADCFEAAFFTRVSHIARCIAKASSLERKAEEFEKALQAYFLLAQAFVSSNWQFLVEHHHASSTLFSNLPDLARLDILLWLNLTYSRTEQSDLQSATRNEIVRMSSTSQYFNALLVLELEAAGLLMGKGNYDQCLRSLAALENEIQGDFWKLRLLTFKGTCYQAKGDYQAVRSTFAEQEKLTLRYNAEPITFPFVRRALSAAVEFERYDEAWELVHKYRLAIEASRLKATRLLFFHEVLRLELVTSDLNAAESSLKKIQSYAIDAGVSKNFVSLVEELSEIALLQNNTAHALETLREFLWECQMRGDRAGQCVVQLFIGRALEQRGALQEARVAIENGLAIATSGNYGKARVRALLHLAGVLYRLGHERSSQEIQKHLLEAHTEARLLMLPAQQLCAAWAISWMSSNTPLLKPFLDFYLNTHFQENKTQRLQQNYLSQAVNHYCLIYGLTPHFQVRVRQLKKSTGEIGFAQIEESRSLAAASDWALSVIREAGVTIFPFEQILLCKNPGSSFTEWNYGLEKKNGRQAAQLFDSLVRSRAGLSLEELFDSLHSQTKQKNKGHPRFQPYRHSRTLHSAIARLRSQAELFHIDIHFEKESKRYLLQPKLRSSASSKRHPKDSNEPGILRFIWPEVQRNKEAHEKQKLHRRRRLDYVTPREKDILERLQTHAAAQPKASKTDDHGGSASGLCASMLSSQLCLALGITRQTMHPMIKNLRSKGMLRLRGKGKATRIELLQEYYN